MNDERLRDTFAAGATVRPFPWAAALAAGIILATEFLWVQPRWTSWAEPLNEVVYLKKQRMTSTVPADKLAILGDSRVFHLEPRQIMNALGLRGPGDNYSWTWCGYEAYDIMLRTLISRKATPPGVIIVSSHPEMPAYAPKWTIVGNDADMRERLYQAAPLTSQLETLVSLHEYKNALMQFERSLMPPSFVYSPSIKRYLKDKIHHRPYDTQPAERQRMISGFESTGAFLYHTTQPENFETFEKTAGPFKVHKNAQARKAFSHFLARASAHNIKVIMIPLPVPKRVYDTYSDRGILADYARQVDAWKKQYPSFHPLGPVAWSYPPEDFIDPGHVNETGQKRHDTDVDHLLRDSGIGKTLNP